MNEWWKIYQQMFSYTKGKVEIVENSKNILNGNYFTKEYFKLRLKLRCICN